MALIQVAPQEQAAFTQMLADYVGNQFLTVAQLNAALSANGASFNGIASWQTAVIASNVATISARQGRITYVKLDTEGFSMEDDCDTLTFAAGLFASGDLLFVSLLSGARAVTLTSIDNMEIKGGRWQMRELKYIALLQWHEDRWVTLSLSPDNQTGNSLTRATHFVTGGGAPSVLFTSQVLDIKEIGAETLAEGAVTITAGGGNISVYIDEGAGPYLIGTYFMPAPEPIATGTTNLAAAITALGTGYTAANVANVCEIMATVGSGASANAYTLSVTIDGTAAATVTAQMGVTTLGVNGAEVNSILEYLIGGEDTNIAYLRNAMAANTLTLGNIVATDGIASAQVLAAGEMTPVMKLDGIWYPFTF